MRTFVFNVICFILVLITARCENKVQKNYGENSLEVKSDTLKNEYAQSFQIIYGENETKINVLDPLTKKIIQSYFINDVKSNATNVFSPEMQHAVVMSTSHIGFLRKLNLENKISGVSDFNFLCQELNNKDVAKVGEMGMTNPEAFMKVKSDIILHSGFNLEEPILNKLEQVGLKAFLIYEWQEMHPLGRAEWIKVFGALFNKEKEADLIFQKVKEDYLEIADKLKKSDTNPSMFAGTYFGDVFNAPAGESYMAQLFKDANVDYVYADTKGTGSLNLSLEEVILDNSTTSFWLNAYANSKNDLINQNSKFKLLDAVKTGALYSYTKNLNCFFEESAAEPHLILEDLGKIFHPDLYDSETMKFYSKLK